MPTLLKKPITVKVTTIESAIAALMSFDTADWDGCDPRVAEIDSHSAEPVAYEFLRDALASQGIDYRTWTPPQPLKAGKYDAQVLPGGAIKVEGQTITREQILELKKASDEASQSEWPKWCHHKGDKSTLEFHKDHSKSLWHHHGQEPLPVAIYKDYERALTDGFTPITATEAARILGKE